jgi:hypothetical protein
MIAHGADVLLVTSPYLPSLPFLDVDTSRGKRTTQLDLNNTTDAETLRALVRDADVFLQSYRPRGLVARGFGPEDCAALRSGIVHASLTGFSPGGPWQDVKSVRFFYLLFVLIAPEDERVCCGNISSTRSCRRLAVSTCRRLRHTLSTSVRRPERKKLPSCPRTAHCPYKRSITLRGTSSHSVSQPRSAKP